MQFKNIGSTKFLIFKVEQIIVKRQLIEQQYFIKVPI
jgi:hypothetical protein